MDKLFEQLNALVEQNDAFKRTDQEWEGHQYSIFTYNYAAFNDFVEGGLSVALEARGITFRHENGLARIVCRPMEKFFNLNENEHTQEHLFHWDRDIVSIEEKVDGSLVSTVVPVKTSDELIVKTKGSFHSEQAYMARDYLTRHPNFVRELQLMVDNGFTVNMEYVGPDNRIVLPYHEEYMFVLNVRHVTSGEYMPRDDLAAFRLIRERLIREHIDEVKLKHRTVSNFIESVPDQTDIEGFVLTTNSGQRIKIKTTEYTTKHRAKDDVFNDNALYEAVIHEQCDDLRALFTEDQTALDRINRFEQEIFHNLRSVIAQVDKYFEDNRELSRKEYAIKAKEEQPRLMPLVMKRFEGREPDYESFALNKKNRDIFINAT